ncbi:MAG: T9SS type A sorting domain-containing protein [Bacteroidia bacterium]
MKKTTQVILTICCLLLFTDGIAQQGSRFMGLTKLGKQDSQTETKQRQNKKANPDPFEIIVFSPTGNGFDTMQNIRFWYNAAGEIISTQTGVFAAGKFEPVSKDTLIYNSAGKLSVTLTRINMGQGWVNNLRIQRFYNPNGELEEELYQLWDEDSGSWELLNGTKTLYTYDDNDRPIEVEHQSKFAGQTSYIPNQKDIITYGSNDEPKEVEVYVYDVTSSSWELETKTINIIWHKWTGSLDMENLLLESAESVYWDGSQWQKDARITAAYNDEDYPLEQTIEVWNGSAYIGESRETYSYDAHGNPLTYIEEEYINFISAWDTLAATKHEYEYNADNSIDTEVLWEFDNGEWSRVVKLLYLYSPISGIAQKRVQSSFKVYPNPVVDLLNLDLTNDDFTVTITDLTGRPVLQARNEKRLAVGHLKTGIYLVHIASEDGIATSKFIRN